MAKEARSKSKGWREEEEGGRVGANFGCMACGVQITIFSAALRRRHHSICSITICCRETEREEEEEGDGGGVGEKRASRGVRRAGRGGGIKKGGRE